jgi:hypothetical protein
VTERTLNASWLAARHGVDPVRIERRRRAGELLAVRDKAGGEWRYPMWQFDEQGELRPAVAELLELARERRIPPAKIGRLLDRKVGLIGGKTVGDLLRNGGSEQALAEIRAAI